MFVDGFFNRCRVILAAVILIMIWASSCEQPEKTKIVAPSPDGTEKTGKEARYNVAAYLARDLIGWRIPDTAEYIKSWWSFYDKKTVPYTVATDLNDDGRTDYAYLLEKDRKLRLVIITTSGKDTFTHWVAQDINEPVNGNGIHFGLTIEPPGRIDVAKPAILSLVLRSNAVNLMDYEERIRIYYVEDGRIKVFYTR